HGPPDQFLQEGGGGAVGALHGQLHVRLCQVQRYVLAVEREQAFPGERIGQGDLDRYVDPSRPRGQGGFQQVGTVRGEQEQQVGVWRRAVHGVEQVEQDRAGGRAE